jgi:hypothetical protein
MLTLTLPLTLTLTLTLTLNLTLLTLTCGGCLHCEMQNTSERILLQVSCHSPVHLGQGMASL